jgi:hypothetical protein
VEISIGKNSWFVFVNTLCVVASRDFFYAYDRKNVAHGRKNLQQLQHNLPYTSNSLSLKRITGGINGGLINDATLRSLDFKRDFLFPLSLLLCNTRPVGRQVVKLF